MNQFLFTIILRFVQHFNIFVNFLQKNTVLLKNSIQYVMTLYKFILELFLFKKHIKKLNDITPNYGLFRQKK